MIKVTISRKLSSLEGITGFWGKLGFWVAVILTFKEYLRHQERLRQKGLDSQPFPQRANNQPIPTSPSITINGKKVDARVVEIIDGHIYADGRYINPEEITEVEGPSRS